MLLDKLNSEFSRQRASRYKKAVDGIGGIWNDDLNVMLKHLNPQNNETILEIGAGSGFFTFPIADKIGEFGRLYALDPSAEQLQPIIDSNINNIIPVISNAEEFSLDCSIDKFWSRGAFHHVKDKTQALKCWYKHSNINTEIFIFDVFTHNNSANFFDGFIAQSCITGHEVAFLSKEFSKSLCLITGWEIPNLYDYSLRWKFMSEDHLGYFLHTLLGVSDEFSISDTLEAAKKYLRIEKFHNHIVLYWEMTLLTTKRKNNGK